MTVLLFQRCIFTYITPDFLKEGMKYNEKGSKMKV